MVVTATATEETEGQRAATIHLVRLTPDLSWVVGLYMRACRLELDSCGNNDEQQVAEQVDSTQRMAAPAVVATRRTQTAPVAGGTLKTQDRLGEQLQAAVLCGNE